MIDEIWANMNEEAKELKKTIKKKKQTLVQSDITMEYRDQDRPKDKVNTLLSSMGIAPAAHGKGGVDKRQDMAYASTSIQKSICNDAKPIKTVKKGTKSIVSIPDKNTDRTLISCQELMSKVARDVNTLNEEARASARRKALQSIHAKAFMDHTMTESDYNIMFRDICKALLKRMLDQNEGCREEAHRLMQAFVMASSDLVPVLGYFFPVLMKRIPNTFGYDDELKIFVSDRDAHDAYKRGRAVERQDKSQSIPTHFQPSHIIETSEEVRLTALQTLSAILKRVVELHATPILHAYFEDMIIFIQAHVADPCPEAKIQACHLFQQLSDIADYELGLKFYVISLVRLLLPLLRHRLAKVRIACLQALYALYAIKDHAKRKCAASETILDLVGFKEDNVLPINAFYNADVTINYLADIVQDTSAAVKECLVNLLTRLLAEIEDKRDYETRLLPYLLDLLCDPIDSVSARAYALMCLCGKQYETEHYDELLAKKQYAVDGTRHLHHQVLLAPFHTRPSLGARLYVRGNTKRFLSAVCNELTHWRSNTRQKSLHLLTLLVILCEEGLTIECNQLYPVLIKSYHACCTENAHHSENAFLLQYIRLFELLGRYIPPDIYMAFLLPRLKNEDDINLYSNDHAFKQHVLHILALSLYGSQPTYVAPHFDALCALLSDPWVFPSDSLLLQATVVDTAVMLLQILCYDVHEHDLYTTIPAVANTATDVQAQVLSHLIEVNQANNKHITVHNTNAHHKILHAKYQQTGRMQELHASCRQLLCLLARHLSSPVLGKRCAYGLQLLLLIAPSQYNRMESFIGHYGRELLEQFYGNTSLDNQALIVPSHAAAEGVGSMICYEIAADWTAAMPEHQLLQALVQLFVSHVLVLAPHLARLIPLLDYLIALCVRLSGADGHDAAMLGHLRLLESLLQPMLHHLSSASAEEQHLFADRLPHLLKLACSAKLSRTIPLQQQRLSLLRCLTLEPATLATSSSMSSSICGAALGAALVQHLEGLLHALASGLHSAEPQVRLATLDGLVHVMHTAKMYLGIHKVLPFGIQQQQPCEREEERMSACYSVYSLLTILLTLLHDGNDEVRLSNVGLLTELVPFILSRKQWHAYWSIMPASASAMQLPSATQVKAIQGMQIEAASDLDAQSDAGAARGAAEGVFESLCALLLQHLVGEVRRSPVAEGQSGSSYVEQLDVLLRLLAVLDAKAFEQEVRKVYMQQQEDEVEARECLNALLNHADILCSLR